MYVTTYLQCSYIDSLFPPAPPMVLEVINKLLFKTKVVLEGTAAMKDKNF